MKYLLIIATVLVVAIGVAGFVYGGADDSPGLQLLSAVLIVGALVYGVRTLRGSRKR